MSNQLGSNNNVWCGRPVLVTGASGFFGRWLSRRLQMAGAELVCLTRNRIHGNELLLSDARYRIALGDICDREWIEQTIGKYKIDVVFHLAAQAIAGTTSGDPVPAFQTNIGGTWNVLEACRRSPGVSGVLLASSHQVYGNQGQAVCTEDTPLRARHPYGVSKSCGEMIAQAYAKTYGLPVAVARWGNLYGGGDLNQSRIVPGTIQSVLRAERPIIRSDGKSLRDYMYVEDSAAGFMVLAEGLIANRDLRGEAFNFSNEDPTSALDLANRILRRMNSPLAPDVRGEASGDHLDQYISAARARKELGWTPSFTLDAGLDRTIAWYREFLTSSPQGSGANASRNT
jgi:CDP-glucose 4,6-dehydratase